MVNQLSIELVGVARYQLEELLEALPDASYSVSFDSPSLHPDNMGELGGAPIDSLYLSARWSDTLNHALSLDLHDFTAAKLKYFLEEVPGDAELFPQLFIRTANWELLALELQSGTFIIEWEDQPAQAESIEALDLEDEGDWESEVHHWAQELEAEASRTGDAAHREELRRRTQLLLGVAEYAGRYEDLDH